MQSDHNIHFEFAQATDVGCVRELNEDNLIAKDGFWLVADGMGGHACGEVASQIAVNEIVEDYPQTGSLDTAIQNAHTKIINAASEDANRSGMGTTVVAMVSDAQAYHVSWVGDSRAYLWDATQNKLSQLTTDHSLMVRLINAGLITEEDAKTHPQRHMITQCLGSTEISQVTVDSISGTWKANQQILLCSDGLSDEVSEYSIAEILSSNRTTSEKVQALVDRAKRSGGRDNITLILVESPVTSEPSVIEAMIERLQRIFSLKA